MYSINLYGEGAQHRMARMWDAEVRAPSLGCCLGAPSMGQTGGAVTPERLCSDWTESGWPRIDYPPQRSSEPPASMQAEVSGVGLLLLGSAEKLRQQSSHPASGRLSIASWHFCLLSTSHFFSHHELMLPVREAWQHLLLCSSGTVASALPWKHRHRAKTSKDKSTHNWSHRHWKSWVFGSASKEVSSPVF